MFGIGCTLVEPGGARTDFRNRSARVAPMLEAYNASPSRMVNRIIADTTLPSAGDPAKMVEAMIASVDQEPTPRRIALGSDAYQVMRASIPVHLSERRIYENVLLVDASGLRPDDEQAIASALAAALK